MNRLDILIPFALPPVELARDLLRQCQAPALSMLLGRGRLLAAPLAHDPFSRALPHEHWLARRFGLRAPAQDSSPAAAIALMRQLGHTPQAGHWLVLHPAHIHVARDHLVLTDIAQLPLEEAESRQLFDSAAPLFVELGHELIYGDARTWFVRADAWAGLRTSSPGAAAGRNVDIWMPEGQGELAWRKLQNEVQMQWFTEALNEQRELQGKKTVNSLWLWGGANADTGVDTDNTNAPAYTSSHGLSGWTRAFGPVLPATAEAVIGTAAGHRLLLLDALTDAALAEEWGMWLQALEALDREWATPLLAALRAGQLDDIELVLSGADRLTRIQVSRSSLRRFWIKPSLAKLGK